MKKRKLLWGFFILFASGILIAGCQKNISNDSTGKEELEIKVNTWLNNGQSRNSISRKERIEMIRKNLDFTAMSTETLSERNNILFIPLKSGFTPRANNADDPVNGLLLVTDKIGNINTGVLVQFIPANKNNRSLDGSMISKVLNDKNVNVDGRFVFLSTFDRFLNEKKYENGILVTSKGMDSKSKQIQDTRVEEEICIDWYLITTIYYMNGTTETTEEYVGTTCYEGCQPNELCDELEGAGGGGQSEFDEAAEAALMAEVFSAIVTPGTQNISITSQTETQYPFTWVVVENSFGLWRVISSDVAVGYNQPSTGAVIYNILHQGSAITGQTVWNRISRNPSNPITPLINLSWQETSFSKTIASDYKSGTITLSGNLKNFGITIKTYTKEFTVTV